MWANLGLGCGKARGDRGQTAIRLKLARLVAQCTA